jgi:hypothetical protein
LVGEESSSVCFDRLCPCFDLLLLREGFVGVVVVGVALDGNVDGNADATSRALSRARTSLAASRYLAISATRWSGNSWRAMWRGSESELERKEGREEEDVSSFLFGSVAVRGSRSLFLQPRAHSKPLSSKLLLAFFLSLSLSRFFSFSSFLFYNANGTREPYTTTAPHPIFPS